MKYIPVPPSKFDEVINHLKQHFTDEPLSDSVGLYKPGPHWDLLLQYDIMTLEEGLSIMALEEEVDAITGVALNGITRQGDLERSAEEMKTIDNIIYQRIFGLINAVNMEVDLFEKYHVDKIFELRILSVDSSYRGKRIANELFSRSELTAEEHGCQLVKVDATSFFTQKICEKFGYKVEKSVTYADYKNENGEKIYNTKFPHEYYKIMVKELSSNSGRNKSQ